MISTKLVYGIDGSFSTINIRHWMNTHLLVDGA